MKLSDVKIRNAKPAEKPYKLTDGAGLHLYVDTNGRKTWRIRYYYLRKERTFSIGPYPLYSLAEARKARDDMRKLLDQGIDPNQHRRDVVAQKVQANLNTFEAVARRWHEVRRGTDIHKQRSIRRLELYAFPRLGSRPIQDITTMDIVLCLEAVEKRGILETAHRIKHLIQQVFRYAVRRGQIVHNPAADLRDILAFPQQNHYACIPPAELPDLLKSIENYGDGLTKLAIKLMAHTFVRTNELIGAKWDEFDWDRAEWRIPAERMKMKRPHTVPLARQSIALLEEIKAITGRRVYVFHSGAAKEKHLSNGTILKALKIMGYQGRMTGHGFRSLASTILNEQRKYHPDVIEKQLAHTDQNQVRAAYNRADYLMERKVMMQDWADFLENVTKQGEKVIYASFGGYAASERQAVL